MHVPWSRYSEQPWSLEPPEVDSLMDKIRRRGVPLKEFAGIKPYRGVTTGLNEAFLIDQDIRNRLIQEDPNCSEIIKPYLRGQDIKRWAPQWDRLWMIFARRGIKIEEYPAVKSHLEGFRTQLEPRPRDWDVKANGAWPGRKPGRYEWYEIQDSVEYWKYFERKKIVYQAIQFHSSFALDEGLYGNNKTFLIPSADFFLIGCLNSPLMWWHNWR